MKFMAALIGALPQECQERRSSTRVTVTEHGCFLDGLDNVEQRKAGTEQLLDALGAELARI